MTLKGGFSNKKSVKQIVSQKKIVVYTAIFGNIKDELRNPIIPYGQEKHDEIDYVAFLDTPQTNYDGVNNIWQIVPPVFRIKNHRRQARAHKVLAHKVFPNYEYSLWIDGCLQLINEDISPLIKMYLDVNDLCVFRHKKRICVYEELAACIDQEKDDPDIMINQVKRYSKEGYPTDNGLGETTALLRKHTKRIEKFNELWWREIESGSFRDQLSFDYVAWKSGIKYSVFQGTCSGNPHFNWFRH